MEAINGVARVIFGPKKLPELGKGLGEAIRGFKKGVQEISADGIAAEEKPTQPEK